jgi:hypothetical protein
MKTDSDELVADFGPYELVIRKNGDEYVAVLWRTVTGEPARRVMTASGPSLNAAKSALEAQYYKAMVQKTSTADPATYARAFAYLWPKLTEKQRAMIQAQIRAPGHTLSTRQLAEVAGWKTHSPVNLWYGLAGFALFGEVPREIQERNGEGAPVYSFALSTGERTNVSGETVWKWTLRPAVAEGLRQAGCA